MNHGNYFVRKRGGVRTELTHCKPLTQSLSFCETPRKTASRHIPSPPAVFPCGPSFPPMLSWLSFPQAHLPLHPAPWLCPTACTPGPSMQCSAFFSGSPVQRTPWITQRKGTLDTAIRAGPTRAAGCSNSSGTLLGVLCRPGSKLLIGQGAQVRFHF